MAKQRFGRKPHGEVIIDVCWDCHALWFDQYESTSLTPAAVVELFRQIHEHRDKPARTLGDRLACPHCSSKLALTQDVLRANRFTYHRCTRGHGRLTTFVQFLREKHFAHAALRHRPLPADPRASRQARAHAGRRDGVPALPGEARAHA